MPCQPGRNPELRRKLLERRRDLSLYQGLGFSRRELMMMIGIQGFLLGLVGATLGYLTALGVGEGAEWFDDYPSGLSIQTKPMVYLVSLIYAFHRFPRYHPDRARGAPASTKTD